PGSWETRPSGHPPPGLRAVAELGRKAGARAEYQGATVAASWPDAGRGAPCTPRSRVLPCRPRPRDYRDRRREHRHLHPREVTPMDRSPAPEVRTPVRDVAVDATGRIPAAGERALVLGG